MPKPLLYTEKYVTEILNKMNDSLKAEEKAGKIKTLFLEELFLNQEINYHNWLVNVHNKYKNEQWYKELYSEIKSRLYIRICKMAIQNPKLTALAIWFGKVNHGIKEPVNEVENTTIDVRFEEL